MTYEVIKSVLDEYKSALGVPYCYHHFKDRSEIEGKSCYAAYFEIEKGRFLADDKVYTYDFHFAVELYTKVKDTAAERKLMELFDQYEVVWYGGETVYIEDEKVYMTVFYC